MWDSISTSCGGRPAVDSALILGADLPRGVIEWRLPQRGKSVQSSRCRAFVEVNGDATV